MKRFLAIIAFLSVSCTFSFAQENSIVNSLESASKKESNILNHLDLSLTAGSTGIGFDLAMPIGNMVQVRAGATFVPHIEKTMSFGVEVGGKKEFDAYCKKYPDEYTFPDQTLYPAEYKTAYNDAYSQWSKKNFNKLSSLLTGFMGLQVDDNIDMIGEPTFNQAKLMVDVFPFKNKNWHFTAGFYLGDHRLAKAYNSTYDAPSLVSVNTYNTMYNKALAEEPLISYGDINLYNEQINSKLLSYGKMTLRLGNFKHDVYATEDIYYDHSEVDPIFGEPVVDDNGREITKGSLRYAKGEKIYSEGDAFRMTPDENCMVKANAFINSFRPYIGFGYGGYLDKKYKRTKLSFDCGVMFWGGVPKVITYDRIGLVSGETDESGNVIASAIYQEVDLMNDLTDVRASVKKYLDIMRCFPVYPVLEIRLSQRIF